MEDSRYEEIRTAFKKAYREKRIDNGSSPDQIAQEIGIDREEWERWLAFRDEWQAVKKLLKELYPDRQSY